MDLDGGIFVPHPCELYTACQHSDFMEKSAIVLCEKLLLPKKLALNLVSSFKEALSGGVGPQADELLQKVFFRLLGHVNKNFEVLYFCFWRFFDVDYW